MNLLSWHEIWRVLLIGLFSGITVTIGFAMSWWAYRDYIRFLQDLIFDLEAGYGRDDTDGTDPDNT